jgi:hypothetical protein
MGRVSAAEDAARQFPARLLPLVNDLEDQLQLAYGFDRPALDARIQYTLEVIAAWQRSTHSAQDEALLEGWLHDAIERSLPGRRASLAHVPAFSRPSEPAAPNLPAVGEAQASVSKTVVLEPAESAAIARRPPELTFAPVPEPLAPREDEPRPSGTPAVRHPPHRMQQSDPNWSIARAATSPPAPLRETEPDLVTGPSIGDDEPEDDDRSIQDGMDRQFAHVSVELNVSEYAARLVGQRRGLERLEASILMLSRPTADQLAELVGELESLQDQGALLNLYVHMLPTRMQAAYGPQASSEVAVTMLQDLIARRHAEVAGRASLDPSHAHESAQLHTLVERLDRMTAASAAPIVDAR